MLSRAKPALAPSGPPTQDATEKKKMPSLDSFIAERDFLGAITLLEVRVPLYQER